MRVIEQQATPKIVFLLVASDDHFAPVMGLGSTPVATISKNGGTFSATTNAVSEVGNGWYQVTLTNTETYLAGINSWDLILHATGSGADPTDRLFAMELGTLSNVDLEVDALMTSVSAIPTAPLLAANYTAPPTAAAVATAVWANATRTLSSFGTLAADAATAVWAAGARTLTAFGFSVTAATVTDKTGYSLAASQTCNITGNLSGSVGSVTGAVGSVSGAVASVTGAVTLATSQPNYAPAKTGDAMTLTAAYDPAKTVATVPDNASIATILSRVTGSVALDATVAKAAGPVTLAASQPNYAPAKAGDAMALTAAYDAAKTAATQASVAALGSPMQATARPAGDYPASISYGTAGIQSVTWHSGKVWAYSYNGVGQLSGITES